MNYVLFTIGVSSTVLAFEVWAETPIPDGAFRECPECPVIVKLPDGASIGVYPVTLEEFAVFAEATAVKGISECFIWTGTQWRRRPETGWAQPGFEQGPDHPVVCVSWLEATAYTDWLSERTGQSYRLPTIEESAAAAAAGSGSDFWWGEDFDLVCDHANAADQSFRVTYPDDTRPILDCEDGFAHTNPVSTFAPNAYGLHDTLGNVWEWTNSCLQGDCSNALFRGAAWATPFQRHFKKDGQWADRILLRNSGIGFRVIRDPEF